MMLSRLMMKRKEKKKDKTRPFIFSSGKYYLFTKLACEGIIILIAK